MLGNALGARKSVEENGVPVRRGLPVDWAKICNNITPFNPELRPNAGIEEFLATLKGKL